MSADDSPDEHARPTREEPLTPPTTKAPTHAERARTLVALQRTGALATLDPQGSPHVSYVTFALDGGDPVFLFSRLATHTQHLEGDPRASLLVHESRAADPLANGRVTLLGRCERLVEASEARRAFLERQPESSYYVDFADFGFFRLRVERVRYIGGYGRMSWVDAEAWHEASPDPLAEHADAIVAHMNDDHADALVAYARAFTRAVAPSDVRMTGVDRYGFDLSVKVGTGRRPARIAFEQEVTTPEAVRHALVRLVARARSELS